MSNLEQENKQLKAKLEIALHGLKRLADVSDDFVYSKAFYCCDFAQGIINRINSMERENDTKTTRTP